MSDEIDISKLHGDIKLYAQMVDRDSANSKGHGKLNTQYELNLFKEMVIKNGKLKELIQQLPNIKGVTVSINENKTHSGNVLKNKEQEINTKIISLMKDDSTNSSEDMKNAVAEKKRLKSEGIS